ncbi:MAG: hypothetical protein WBM02_00185 [bacterium]
MNKLLNLISDIELAIRYLLSGVAITAIYLFSLSGENLEKRWDLISEHQALALFLVGALGFAVYTLYRILYWIIADEVAWWTYSSAATLDRKKLILKNFTGTKVQKLKGFLRQFLRHFPYAKFLQWRRAENFNKSLNGYLHYRWAVVHFTFIFALTLRYFISHCEFGSLIRTHESNALIAWRVFIVAAIWQSWFLFRVEKALYSDSREKEKQSNENTNDSK